jgi:cellobiose phosphorylase
MSNLDESLQNVTVDFKLLLEDTLKKIFSEISNDYNIEYEELLNKYITKSKKNVEIKKKKKKVNEVADANRCIANTAKYTRCTKSKHPGIDFCGFHKNQQKYGVVKPEKETLTVEDIEYIVHDNKLFMKEKMQDLHGDLGNVDFSILTLECDGVMEEDGSLCIY